LNAIHAGERVLDGGPVAELRAPIGLMLRRPLCVVDGTPPRLGGSAAKVLAVTALRA
jgi:hypothetical protein